MNRIRIVAATMMLIAAPLHSVGQQFSFSPRPIAAMPIGARREVLSEKSTACAAVAASINSILRTSVSNNGENPPVPREIVLGSLRWRDLDCGAIPSLVRDTQLELAKIFYDSRVHSWEFLVRCTRNSDCVPFLVRWPQTASRGPVRLTGPILAPVPSSARLNLGGIRHFLVRPGETVTLVWDQDGIRAVLPVICLDRGNVGDSIRVRIKDGSRVMRAEIVSESLLRAIL